MSFSSRGNTSWDDTGLEEDAPPVRVSTRTMRLAIEEALIGSFTRRNLEVVLAEELGLAWTRTTCEPDDVDLSKRDLVDCYIDSWALPQLVAFARRLDAEVDILDSSRVELRRYIDASDRGGGVEGATKNLIFAANGPKPDIVLRDALNNDIEIVTNADYCLVYDRPVPPDGLRFSRLIRWWRDCGNVPDSIDDRTLGLRLHARLRDSLDSDAERVVFDAYASRYKGSFDVPALVPQVYLHYDPYDQRTRRGLRSGIPLARQRMDFLILFSDRQRVVIEVDGKQHYADGDLASPSRYSEMVAEDRSLRLAGYEVYRFGGYEVTQDPNGTAMVQEFFEQLAERMK